MSTTITITSAFESHWRRFNALTEQAYRAFAEGDWAGLQALCRQRFDCHDAQVQALSQAIPADLDWPQLARDYQTRLAAHPTRELALTFFNSLYARCRPHCDWVPFGQELLHQPITGTQPYRRYGLSGKLSHLIARLLDDAGLPLPLADARGDIRRIARSLRRQLLPLLEQSDYPLHLDLLAQPFLRNKGLYLIGRINLDSGLVPFALALVRTEQGRLRADALLLKREHLSILFGFARSDFLVQSPCPAELVRFLASLVPQKPLSELYAALGHYKQAKTMQYSELVTALRAGQSRFVPAPGIRGMVMAVFMLERHDKVFKVIRDSFPHTKSISHEQVVERYRLVQRHDRVGRMADTQEFVDLRLPLARVDQAVLDELLSSCSQRVAVEGDTLVLRHCFTERRMWPLNLLLQEADMPQREAALADYGQALKDIAAAGLFPGDMLYKNFGVTRHGRVIFYDYDELCPLDEVRFRELPKGTGDPQQQGAEPWFAVAPGDVFPEEFRHFLCARPEAARVLLRQHPELFTPAFWRQAQQDAAHGHMADLFPYPEQLRFGDGHRD
ncbi:bifunctional isocitrate dehydrogenase kinase/phosphatase [Gallaecimonas sp. GXIMD4217]|uniref:bifunctional isocitrate dehydrogenase kinase/phosphatase n=1 Tax=Gallaecimonas sp. GXIMD4217 TaxID=3131927 RepID=UPI00311B1367